MAKQKRFVVRSSWQLGIESSWEDDNGNLRPFWHVYDKQSERIVDGADESSKSLAFRTASSLNEEVDSGTLDESELFWEERA